METNCVITGKKNCAQRDCELHYMDAPVRLAPEPREPFALSFAALAAYVISIPLANLLIAHFGAVPVGFGLFAPAGVFAAGLTFTARDIVQRQLGKGWAFGAVLTGVALSALFATPALALASALAFALSELLDMAIFVMMAKRTFVGAVLTSNAIGLVMDSIIFLSVAFGSLTFLPGQIVGKLWMTMLALAVIIPLRARRAA
jgi:uncharacterized PurR-regulated membrane protein YhhQ (DUF165 family)